MCYTPVQILDGRKDRINVPCGKCPVCVKRRVSGWSFRLMQEYKVSSSAYFLTLTYAPKYCPLSPHGFMDLRKKDVQLFIKRLRRFHEYRRRSQPGVRLRSGQSSIRYYAVGEYGSKGRRPHYHLILFNAKLELIGKAWTEGQVYYGTVNEASVGYCLKYISKPAFVRRFVRDDRSREFSLMSKGLGRNYLSDAMKRWHLDDVENRMYCNLSDGKKICMPRYYKDKVYDEYLRDIVKRSQMERIYKREEEQMLEEGDAYHFNREQKIIAEFRKMGLALSKNQKL